MSFYTILYFFPLCGQTQARDLLPGEERTIIVKIEDHTGGTISSEGKYNLVQVKNVTILVICCAACRVPTRPGKPGKMRVNLENLEISWNFEKFNKYHEKMA